VFTAEAPEKPGIPHAMVYELYALFPGTIGCVDPVGPLNLRLAARSGSTQVPKNLDADHGAPEPRDFFVRTSAARRYARRAAHGTGPPCDPIAPDAAASTAPRLPFVTIAKRPSW
jgi:hypothetical protein